MTTTRDAQDLPEAGITATDAAADDGRADGGGAAAATEEVERPGRLRPLLWRLHFISGFLAAPLALWLAVTGIFYAWNPQIESWLHDDKLNAAADGPARALSDQVESALAAYPDHEVAEVIPASHPGKTTAVMLSPVGAGAEGFGPAPGTFTAYVDPASAELTGTIDEDARPDEWLRNLHSSFRLGDRASTLTELTASLVLVSLLTGVYLWWPKSRRALRRAFVPRLRGLRGGGRRPWRDLHSSVGILMLVVLAGIVVTGLTWTQYAGAWVDRAKDGIGAESPMLSTSLGEPGAEGTGGHGGHAEAAEGEVAASPLDLDQLDQVAAGSDATDLRAPYTITPGPPGDAWSVEEIDGQWPLRQANVAVDPTDGEVVDRLHFSDQSAVDQLTSLGIGFHEGELFGLANQLLLTAMALALIVVIVSGYMTWWRRRPEGAFGAPPQPGRLLRTAPVPLLAGFVLLLVLLPTLGVATVLYLVVERTVSVVRRRPAPAA